ncbi:NUDIX hydrolase [Georgfuchsia toluolica]|uniref:NUDIX hydrolase n=1 Tax=Georgfuchsia toluolica TaxID=424218 RepID=A0A916J7J0_9PROT|nr:MBL fold metallo-hydrolase [Georgfuchsia toluolica]CAG4884625.1 NUDIX hydrolase [Georgfuchsia toluolica]
MIQKSGNNSKALRHAATLLVVRDAPAGMEVLMLQRPQRETDRFRGAYVFPGGVVEDNDRGLYAFCAGLDDNTASCRLGLKEHGLAYFVAAIRECFEEAGLLLAYGPDGNMVDLDRFDDVHLATLLRKLRTGETDLGEICRKLNLRLAVDKLIWYSHWLTPLGIAKRFDTFFFLVVAPPAQTALHDGSEALQHRWLRPAEALAHPDEFHLVTATQRTLESISSFGCTDACCKHALGLKDIQVTMPRFAHSASGLCKLLPNDPAYAEVARLDPEGRGDTSCEIEHGRAVRLSERVIRITAPNGNMMTGPGTNTYLVGGGKRNEWAVIDPGPDMEAHVQNIIAAAPGPIRWIFVTHTHRDHSPAAAQLKSLTGARLHGRLAQNPEWQDSTFQPDQIIAHGDRFDIGAAATLRVGHTPGHASNHVCYLLEEEKTLFTGDHIMQGTTVVISPRDGDMAVYLTSLQVLLQEDIEWLAPGHGHLMDHPYEVIQKTIQHRMAREEKIVAALGELASADVDTLLDRVYDDVPVYKHPIAKRSLMAHLLKLGNEGVALENNGHWRLIE